MKIEFLDQHEFKKAHATLQEEVFGKVIPESDNFDYAVVVSDKNSSPIVYVTVRKLSDSLCFLEFGGASQKHSVKVVPAFMWITNVLLEQFKEITMSVRNTNFPMIKIATKFGFVVTGTQYTADKQLMLLYSLERGE